MNTNDIISAMVAEHAENELAAEERKRAAEAEREKLVKFDQAISILRDIGALSHEEIDALFADAAVEIDNDGAEAEGVLLQSVTLPGLRVRVHPRLKGSAARIFCAVVNHYQSADIWEPEHRALALAIVAEAVRRQRQAAEHARFAENMRSQS